mgnify:CR=1 FL=1
MEKHVDSVLSALRDSGIVMGEQIDKANNFFFVDDALQLEPLKEGQIQISLHPVLSVLLDADIHIGDDEVEE